MQYGRGRGLQNGRGRTSGRGAAIMRILQYFDMPVVGASADNPARGMPALEPADTLAYVGEEKRNWG